MTDIRHTFENYTPDQRQAALETLDAVSRPMTVREIEGALRMGGVSRSRAVKLASTLKHFSIIAVAGPEQADG